MNFDSRKRPVWQLPVANSEKRGNAYIHPKAKYHCFKNCGSLCGMYCQRTEDYDDGITISSAAVLEQPHLACRSCLKKWKKQYQVEG